jgi:hypothetical protein
MGPDMRPDSADSEAGDITHAQRDSNHRKEQYRRPFSVRPSDRSQRSSLAQAKAFWTELRRSFGWPSASYLGLSDPLNQTNVIRERSPISSKTYVGPASISHKLSEPCLIVRRQRSACPWQSDLIPEGNQNRRADTYKARFRKLGTRSQTSPRTLNSSKGDRSVFAFLVYSQVVYMIAVEASYQ